MKTFLLRIVFCGLVGLVLALMSLQAGEKKDDTKGEKPAVAALPPHPLDGAFEKGKSERELTNGLLNNKLFQQAVKEALKAKRDQEEAFRKNPKLITSSPAQAARLRFLEVIIDEKKPAK